MVILDISQWNPSVCIRRGRSLRVQEDVAPDAEGQTFTAGLEGGRRGREGRKAGPSNAGRSRSCLEKQDMLLKPCFRADLWNWEVTGSHCFEPLRWW